MDKVSLEECQWCNGTGTDGEYGQFPCFDCEATGFKCGKAAAMEHERQIEEAYRLADEKIDQYESSCEKEVY